MPFSGLSIAKMIVSVRNRLPFPHHSRMSEPRSRMLTMPLGASISPMGPMSVGNSKGRMGVGEGVGVGNAVGSYDAVGGIGWNGVGVAVASGGASNSGGKSVSVGPSWGTALDTPIELGAAQAASMLVKINRKSKRLRMDIGAISRFMG